MTDSRGSPDTPNGPDRRFRPSVTVAAVVESGGRYLLVEEHTADGLRLNNPAGHLERGESPLEAVQREALEETARRFVPEAFLGVYLARTRDAASGADITYVRLAYAGRAGEVEPGRALDAGIVRTLWLDLEAVRCSRERHRSPLVLQCVEDHAAGRRLPLDTVFGHTSLGEPR
jgi:8-oxo-dGTP pyrophosphatase MutT (NUDIX family)